MSGKGGKHQSCEKVIKRTLEWMEKMPFVSRVILGRAEPARHRYPPGMIKFQMEAPGGCKLKAFGGNGVMDIYVKIDPIEMLPEFIELLEKRMDN